MCKSSSKWTANRVSSRIGDCSNRERSEARIALIQYAGGLIVAFYVLSITFTAPRFGVGNAILFAVTAQLVTSALIDHFALAGAALRPVTAMRMVGLLVVIAGLVLTQLSDHRAAGSH